MNRKKDLVMPEFLREHGLMTEYKLSEESEEFLKYKAAYEKRLGDGYGFCIGGPAPTREEMLEDIKECLKSGKPSEKPWMDRNYEKGVMY